MDRQEAKKLLENIRNNYDIRIKVVPKNVNWIYLSRNDSKFFTEKNMIELKFFNAMLKKLQKYEKHQTPNQSLESFRWTLDYESPIFSNEFGRFVNYKIFIDDLKFTNKSDIFNKMLALLERNSQSSDILQSFTLFHKQAERYESLEKELNKFMRSVALKAKKLRKPLSITIKINDLLNKKFEKYWTYRLFTPIDFHLKVKIDGKLKLEYYFIIQKGLDTTKYGFKQFFSFLHQENASYLTSESATFTDYFNAFVDKIRTLVAKELGISASDIMRGKEVANIEDTLNKEIFSILSVGKITKVSDLHKFALYSLVSGKVAREFYQLDPDKFILAIDHAYHVEGIQKSEPLKRTLPDPTKGNSIEFPLAFKEEDFIFMKFYNMKSNKIECYILNPFHLNYNTIDEFFGMQIDKVFLLDNQKLAIGFSTGDRIPHSYITWEVGEPPRFLSNLTCNHELNKFLIKNPHFFSNILLQADGFSTKNPVQLTDILNLFKKYHMREDQVKDSIIIFPSYLGNYSTFIQRDHADNKSSQMNERLGSDSSIRINRLGKSFYSWQPTTQISFFNNNLTFFGEKSDYEIIVTYVKQHDGFYTFPHNTIKEYSNLNISLITISDNEITGTIVQDRWNGEDIKYFEYRATSSKPYMINRMRIQEDVMATISLQDHVLREILTEVIYLKYGVIDSFIEPNASIKNEQTMFLTSSKMIVQDFTYIDKNTKIQNIKKIFHFKPTKSINLKELDNIKIKIFNKIEDNLDLSRIGIEFDKLIIPKRNEYPNPYIITDEKLEPKLLKKLKARPKKVKPPKPKVTPTPPKPVRWRWTQLGKDRVHSPSFKKPKMSFEDMVLDSVTPPSISVPGIMGDFQKLYPKKPFTLKKITNALRRLEKKKYIEQIRPIPPQPSPPTPTPEPRYKLTEDGESVHNHLFNRKPYFTPDQDNLKIRFAILDYIYTQNNIENYNPTQKDVIKEVTNRAELLHVATPSNVDAEFIESVIQNWIQVITPPPIEERYKINQAGRDAYNKLFDEKSYLTVTHLVRLGILGYLLKQNDLYNFYPNQEEIIRNITGQVEFKNVTSSIVRSGIDNIITKKYVDVVSQPTPKPKEISLATRWQRTRTGDTEYHVANKKPEDQQTLDDKLVISLGSFVIETKKIIENYYGLYEKDPKQPLSYFAHGLNELDRKGFVKRITDVKPTQPQPIPEPPPRGKPKVTPTPTPPKPKSRMDERYTITNKGHDLWDKIATTKQVKGISTVTNESLIKLRILDFIKNEESENRNPTQKELIKGVLKHKEIKDRNITNDRIIYDYLMILLKENQVEEIFTVKVKPPKPQPPQPEPPKPIKDRFKITKEGKDHLKTKSTLKKKSISIKILEILKDQKAGLSRIKIKEKLVAKYKATKKQLDLVTSTLSSLILKQYVRAIKPKKVKPQPPQPSPPTPESPRPLETEYWITDQGKNFLNNNITNLQLYTDLQILHVINEFPQPMDKTIGVPLSSIIAELVTTFNLIDTKHIKERINALERLGNVTRYDPRAKPPPPQPQPPEQPPQPSPPQPPQQSPQPSPPQPPQPQPPEQPPTPAPPTPSPEPQPEPEEEIEREPSEEPTEPKEPKEEKEKKTKEIGEEEEEFGEPKEPKEKPKEPKELTPEEEAIEEAQKKKKEQEERKKKKEKEAREKEAREKEAREKEAREKEAREREIEKEEEEEIEEEEAPKVKPPAEMEREEEEEIARLKEEEVKGEREVDQRKTTREETEALVKSGKRLLIDEPIPETFDELEKFVEEVIKGTTIEKFITTKPLKAINLKDGRQWLVINHQFQEKHFVFVFINVSEGEFQYRGFKKPSGDNIFTKSRLKSIILGLPEEEVEAELFSDGKILTWDQLNAHVTSKITSQAEYKLKNILEQFELGIIQITAVKNNQEIEIFYNKKSNHGVAYIFSENWQGQNEKAFPKTIKDLKELDQYFG